MLIHVHPFDRYAHFTDIKALKEVSALPLRKSFRVNTLKSSTEEFMKWAKEKGWKIEPVQWCSEGFFVNASSTPVLSEGTKRPSRRAQHDTKNEALGKDLLHQLGHTYMQEAASMLPIELLDPQPGEAVLDMAAAPGSKTTQIAARMACPRHAEEPGTILRDEPSLHSGSPQDDMPGVSKHMDTPPQHDTVEGVIVANDVQEKRLWTLKQALNRCGVTNAIVTKKKGEWFGKHMTERFDRVLCDAPCSAQGVLRKDPNALKYGSEKRIQKLAKNQINLLEAAVHAAKVGGRIVYSTCTLTPEENEGVVMRVLEKFEGKVSSCKLQVAGNLERAIEDSQLVQKNLQLATCNLQPFIRLWPQTYNTEGFFCAVLEKTARTREPIEFEMIPRQEKPLTPRRYRDIIKILEEHFGTSFLQEGDVLLQKADQLLLTTEEAKQFPLPVQDFALGLPFVKGIRDSAHIRLTHDLVTLRGRFAQKNVYDLSDEEAAEILAGKDIPCPEELRGDIILRSQGICIGPAFAKEGNLKNRLSRQLISQL